MMKRVSTILVMESPGSRDHHFRAKIMKNITNTDITKIKNKCYGSKLNKVEGEDSCIQNAC
jgi:hypothetical protein